MVSRYVYITVLILTMLSFSALADTETLFPVAASGEKNIQYDEILGNCFTISSGDWEINSVHLKTGMPTFAPATIYVNITAISGSDPDRSVQYDTCSIAYPGDISEFDCVFGSSITYTSGVTYCVVISNSDNTADLSLTIANFAAYCAQWDGDESGCTAEIAWCDYGGGLCTSNGDHVALEGNGKYMDNTLIWNSIDSLFGYIDYDLAVVNTAPTILSHDLIDVDNKIFHDDDAECYVNATDDLNETLSVSYTWTVQGAVVDSGTFYGMINNTNTLISTLAQSNFLINNNIQCNVTVSDGLLDSAESSDSTQVSDDCHDTPVGGCSVSANKTFSSGSYGMTDRMYINNEITVDFGDAELWGNGASQLILISSNTNGSAVIKNVVLRDVNDALSLQENVHVYNANFTDISNSAIGYNINVEKYHVWADGIICDECNNLLQSEGDYSNIQIFSYNDEQSYLIGNENPDYPIINITGLDAENIIFELKGVESLTIVDSSMTNTLGSSNYAFTWSDGLPKQNFTMHNTIIETAGGFKLSDGGSDLVADIVLDEIYFTSTSNSDRPFIWSDINSNIVDGLSLTNSVIDMSNNDGGDSRFIEMQWNNFDCGYMSKNVVITDNSVIYGNVGSSDIRPIDGFLFARNIFSGSLNEDVVINSVENAAIYDNDGRFQFSDSCTLTSSNVSIYNNNLVDSLIISSYDDIEVYNNTVATYILGGSLSNSRFFNNTASGDLAMNGANNVEAFDNVAGAYLNAASDSYNVYYHDNIFGTGTFSPGGQNIMFVDNTPTSDNAIAWLGGATSSNNTIRNSGFYQITMMDSNIGWDICDAGNLEVNGLDRIVIRNLYESAYTLDYVIEDDCPDTMSLPGGISIESSSLYAPIVVNLDGNDRLIQGNLSTTGLIANGLNSTHTVSGTWKSFKIDDYTTSFSSNAYSMIAFEDIEASAEWSASSDISNITGYALITHPTDLEILTSTTINITWTESSLTVPVYNISYSDDNTTWVEIDTTTDLYYLWDASVLVDGIYYLRIIAKEGAVESHADYESFRLNADVPTVPTVISPNGGEDYSVGQTIGVFWTNSTSDIPVNYSLYWSREAIPSWNLFATITNGVLTYNLDSTALSARQTYKINVTATDGTYVVSDVSNAFWQLNALSGSGGSSSGMSLSCTSSWYCSDWSKCSSSAQTRTCVDLNRCGYITTKPIEVRTCNLFQDMMGDPKKYIQGACLDMIFMDNALAKYHSNDASMSIIDLSQAIETWKNREYC